MSSALNFISDPSTPTGRLLLVAVVLVALRLAPWVGKALVVWAQGRADVTRIKANGQVITDLAKLEPGQVERLHAHLERVRPPPGEIEPPDQAAS